MPDLLWKPERPITHRVEYATQVLRSVSGFETRIATRERPRQSVDLRLRFDTDLMVRRWRTYLFQDLAATWRVPIWWKPETLVTATTAGSDEMRGNFANRDIAVGDTVALLHPSGANDPHVSDVNSATDTLITMDSGVGPEFPAWSKFYKLQDMKVRGDPSYQRLTAGQEIQQFTFDFARPIELGGVGASLETFQHSGDAAAYTLLDRKPLSDRGIQGSFSAFMERVDFGRRFDQFTNVDPGTNFERRVYGINDRDELHYWELFLKTVLGAREPFYTPTYRVDLVHTTQPLVVNTPPWGQFDTTDESDTPVDTFDYAGQYFPHSSHKQLRFGTNLGEQYDEVDSVSDNQDGTEPITLANGLLANTVIDEVSFLERMRLASDGAVFQHFGTRSVIDIGLTLIQRHPDE